MASLKQRLSRVEQTARELMPDQQHCPACGGRERLAFSDEPENTGPPLPFDGPGGICRLCRMPSPGIKVHQLSPPVAEIFARLPWSDEPRLRFVEKLMLLKSLAEHDVQKTTRAVTMLYERATNGPPHGRK